MGLSTREVLIILRARDLASRDIAQVGMAFSTLEGQSKAAALAHIQEGTALAGIGVAMGIAGAAGLKFYGDSLKAAVEYNKEVAYTATQVDNGAQKLQQLGQIGIDVASKIPAPFKEMQASLYDIFSSTDANIQQAQVLLEAFAKGAVAGQTDVQTAGRATISVMNAFKIPFEDVNHVMDVQFNTVKLGVITYEQLASTIGRAIPSAVRAGQSFEDLGGMIAFMTRNGLSAAQAATSAARALDMLSNPEFKTNMDNIGISVTNADGAFRPMVDIVTDLKNRFGDLAPAQRTLEFLRLGGQGSADALKELGINAYDATGALRPFNDVSAELTKHFKGMSEAEVSQELANITHGAGGTIQAMRFLNLAVGDSKNLYQSLTDAIRNSGGAAETAYQLMRATPAMQVQLLSNQWQILKKEIGDGLIPIFSQFIGKINDVLHWFLNLDEKTKNLIATIGLVTSVFLTLTGIFVAIAGGIQILVGLFALLDGEMLGILGWIGLAGALSAAIIFLATKTQFFQTTVKDTGKVFLDFANTYIIPSINLIKDAFRDGGLEGAVKEAGSLIENVFLPMVVSGLGKVYGYLKTELPKWADTIGNELSNLANVIYKWVQDVAPTVGNALVSLGTLLYTWIQDATPIVVAKLGELTQGIIRTIGTISGKILEYLPEILSVLAQITAAILLYIIGTLIPAVVLAISKLPGAIIDAVASAADGLGKALAKMFVLPNIFGDTISNARIFADVITTVVVAALALFALKWAEIAIIVGESLFIQAGELITGLVVAVTNFGAAALLAAQDLAAMYTGIITGATTVTLTLTGMVVLAGALGLAFVLATQKIVGAFAQTSKFANDTKIDLESVTQLLHENASVAAEDLETMRIGGLNVKDAFTQIAQQSPETAQAIIDAMQKAGTDTTLYAGVLKQVQDEHDKVGRSAEEAMSKARNAANQYRGDLDLLLGSINGVQSATAQFDLAVASLNRQVDSNATSTASNTEKQALMQQSFDSVYRSALTLIATVKEHGIQTDADKEAVGRAISAMEEMKAKNPEQAAALQLVIDKLNELSNIPEIHKNNTVTTTYEEIKKQQFDTTEGGSREATGGVVGYALAQGGMVKAAMGVITGFKTDGPTLVGEGNPNYPEFVIASDPAYRDRNIKLYAQAGHALNLYATGGVMGMSDAMQGAVSQIRGAYSQVGSALGNYGGEPGYKPSAEQILMSLNDTASILAGLGGLPGGKTTTLNIHEGAIRIDGSGQPPEVIGMAVEDALENFLRTLQMQ